MFKNARILLEPNNCAGLGGIGPAGITERLGIISSFTISAMSTSLECEVKIVVNPTLFGISKV